MKRPRRVFTFIVICASLILSSCKNKEANIESFEPDKNYLEEAEISTDYEGNLSEEKIGGILYVASDAIVQFDAPFVQDDPSALVGNLVHTALFSWSNNEIKPDFAESWEFQEDGKVIIFHLAKGRTFQDGNSVFEEGQGREIVADDVVYSVHRYVTIEGGSPNSDLANVFENIEAVDKYTVRLTLSKSDIILFAKGRGLSGVWIIPQEAVEKLGRDWAMNPIGGGPFEFVEYVPDDHVTLQRNEDYYIYPNLDGVVFQIIPDPTVQILALEADDVQILSVLTLEDYDRFVENPYFDIYLGTCPVPQQLQFNMGVELFQDKNVREAIAHSFDGRGIMKVIYGDRMFEGCGTAGPGVPGYDPELCGKYFTYDPALTAELLNESGWEKNENGIWEKEGQTLSFELEVWNLETDPILTEAAATQMQEQGIDVELVVVEFGTWVDDWLGGKSKSAMQWSGFCGEGGLDNFWGRNGFATYMGFENEEVWQLLEKANVTIEPEERQSILVEATNLIYQDYPAVSYGFSAVAHVLSKKVRDYKPNLILVSPDNNVWLEKQNGN